MATTKTPLMSFAAAGSVGLLTFAHASEKFGARHTVRKKPKLRGCGRSAPQLRQNERFRAAATAWRLLPPDEKLFWQTHGESAKKYGRNWYISEYLNQRIIAPAQPEQPYPRWSKSP
jgi:hypothetical protein